VVRRWRAPQDGVVKLTGTLQCRSEAGGAFRACLVSSRHGLLERWEIQKQEKADTGVARLAVRCGDTPDFIVLARKRPDPAGFQWAPVIQLLQEPSADQARGVPAIWKAAADFRGPPLSPWHQLAQVLLLANEFVFID